MGCDHEFGKGIRMKFQTRTVFEAGKASCEYVKNGALCQCRFSELRTDYSQPFRYCVLYEKKLEAIRERGIQDPRTARHALCLQKSAAASLV